MVLLPLLFLDGSKEGNMQGVAVDFDMRLGNPNGEAASEAQVLPRGDVSELANNDGQEEDDEASDTAGPAMGSCMKPIVLGVPNPKGL